MFLFHFCFFFLVKLTTLLEIWLHASHHRRQNNNNNENLRCEGFWVMWFINNVLLNASFVLGQRITVARKDEPFFLLHFFSFLLLLVEECECHWSAPPQPGPPSVSPLSAQSPSAPRLVPAWFPQLGSVFPLESRRGDYSSQGITRSFGFFWDVLLSFTRVFLLHLRCLCDAFGSTFKDFILPLQQLPEGCFSHFNDLVTHV